MSVFNPLTRMVLTSCARVSGGSVAIRRLGSSETNNPTNTQRYQRSVMPRSLVTQRFNRILPRGSEGRIECANRSAD